MFLLRSMVLCRTMYGIRFAFLYVLCLEHVLDRSCVHGFRKDQSRTVLVNGELYRKQTILADANIPYKLTIDRNTNILFFCINADEFSDQSFHSAFMDLDTGITSVVPGIRNGFASAVDNVTGTVYLGGSDGIYQFNYNTNDINIPPLLRGVDIFDMFFHTELYFVDTATQNLYVYRDSKKIVIPEVKGCLIHHFVITPKDNLLMVSSMGLYILPKGAKMPMLCQDVPRDLNFRGVTIDAKGKPYFISQDGIYSVDEENRRLNRILSVENGYGLAFDKDNNMVYSDERTISLLIPCDKF